MCLLKKFHIYGNIFNVQASTGWENCIWCSGTDITINIHDNSFASVGGNRAGAIDLKGIEINLTNNVLKDCKCNAIDGGGTMHFNDNGISSASIVRLINNTITNSHSPKGGAIMMISNQIIFHFLNDTFTNCYTTDNGDGL